jgi:hypothetical protein
MSRANPFGDLEDFAAQGMPKPKPVPPAAIEELAQASGFPSRKARSQAEPAQAPAPAAVSPRTQRRRTTGRNRQINIKATEETITALYRIADELDLPLGAVLERALEALERS